MRREVKTVERIVERIKEVPQIVDVYVDPPKQVCPQNEIPTQPPCKTLDQYKIENPELFAPITYDYSQDIHFRDISWKRAFLLREKFIWKNVTRDMPSKFSYPSGTSTNYTTAKFYKSKLGFDIILFSNVCYDVEHEKMIIYAASGSKGKSIVNKIDDKFKNGFVFQVDKSRYPQTSQEIYGSTNWMIIPHSQRNIAHFIEALNYILHTAHFPNDYPPIENVYMPRYRSEKVFPWINLYINILKSSYPPQYPLNIYDRNDILDITSNLLCFKHLGISSRIFHVSYGGVFISRQQVDTLRALTYKHLNLSPQEISLLLPVVSMLERSNVGGNLPGRHIVNTNELHKFFKEHKYEYLFHQLILETLSPQEQIEKILHTDILIGSLGSGFVNCIFMLPGSVIIVASPPYIGGYFFHSISEFAEILYLPIYNYTAPIPDECIQYLQPYGTFSDENCKTLLYKSNVYINPGELSNYLEIALWRLKHIKYPDYVPL
ncbi:hypothetical protein WA158_000780 [Blastocystis sp. Blastoise]